ncbi:MAG: 2-amino-3,7-dideoxy-D-threo-hept-6-ulosonate synthase [Jatrophihabitans sp.]
MNLGKQRRLQRLCASGDGRFLFVPMDHSVSDGPPELTTRFAAVARAAAAAGADALIAHKGRMSTLVGEAGLRGCGLIVHLSASTVHGPDPDAKVVVGRVDEAVRLGADAVSVHVNVGSRSEPEQLAALGDVATQCELLGLPLLAMTYLRGPLVRDPHDALALAHVVNVAIDLGADLVKTSMPHPISSVSRIIDASGGRVIFSGGAEDDSGGFLQTAEFVIGAGAAGLAVGRRVWMSTDPGRVVRELVSLVHGSSRPHSEQLVPASRKETV